MNVIAVSIIASAEPQMVDQQGEWQKLLMTRFFENISSTGIQALTGKPQEKNYCHRWVGISCKAQKVREIRYVSFRYGNFNLNVLPNSTVSIWIYNCNQKFQLSTRLLPKELITLFLARNKVFGPVDLASFPEKVAVVHLWRNNICGPIDLMHLPESMRILSLYHNQIAQETVWFDDLPSNIERIQLKTTDCQNQIYRVRSVNRGNPVDYTVFKGMRGET